MSWWEIVLVFIGGPSLILAGISGLVVLLSAPRVPDGIARQNASEKVDTTVMPHEHWDEVYTTKDSHEVSWYQPVPTESLRLIRSVSPRGSVIDVGAGASTLADELIRLGYDVTVLDIAGSALAAVRSRLGDAVSYVIADLLDWTPGAMYDIWHDRAVFHFLSDDRQRQAYAEVADRAVRPGGTMVIGTFAPDGPVSCSGLPTRRYTADDLAQQFSPTWALESHQREEHLTPSGVVQPFTWVTLRRH